MPKTGTAQEGCIPLLQRRTLLLGTDEFPIQHHTPDCAWAGSESWSHFLARLRNAQLPVVGVGTLDAGECSLLLLKGGGWIAWSQTAHAVQIAQSGKVSWRWKWSKNVCLLKWSYLSSHSNEQYQGRQHVDICIFFIHSNFNHHLLFVEASTIVRNPLLKLPEISPSTVSGWKRCLFSSGEFAIVSSLNF